LISGGTELLAYRGQLPQDRPLDEAIHELAQPIRYPLRYGYAVVGQVAAVGEGVEGSWLGRRVFCLHPHQDRFLTDVERVIPIPDDIHDEEAAFLANMETAVTLVLDLEPRLGERGAVLGCGVVGLLSCGLLSRFPLALLLAMDPMANRRRWAIEMGAHTALHPDSGQGPSALAASGEPQGADFALEVSGSPAALQTALDLLGYDGRLVVGSWYGTKPASLDLGSNFHRQRIRIMSSQVSTLPPRLRGRWDRARRFGVAWEMIRTLKPSRLVTHRFPFPEASQAFHLLDTQPQKALAVLLTYNQGDG
jgi:threonine dehydrogenase-like Zn-dependent dehydrogenase